MSSHERLLRFVKSAPAESGSEKAPVKVAPPEERIALLNEALRTVHNLLTDMPPPARRRTLDLLTAAVHARWTDIEGGAGSG